MSKIVSMLVCHLKLKVNLRITCYVEQPGGRNSPEVAVRPTAWRAKQDVDCILVVVSNQVATMCSTSLNNWEARGKRQSGFAKNGFPCHTPSQGLRDEKSLGICRAVEESVRC
jgi:hypothetical protein